MPLDRRDAMKVLLGASAATALARGARADETLDTPPQAVARRRIPSTGELLPMIGLGTSGTFKVNPQDDVDHLLDVMAAFLGAGGTLIDSSPMYGPAEEVTGVLLDRLGRHDVFFATKVWTRDGREAGERQMQESIRKMAAPVMDLMQVHNLTAWETHLPTLREWKQAGRIRYIGITEMRDLALTEKIMREEDIDFIQIPYSIGDRRVEQRVLPAAQDTNTAVLVMRPFERGKLFRRVEGRTLPEWAGEIDCTSWAQFFLKFVLGHPAVTCPIPATSKVHHLVDNMRAGVGRVPDEAIRSRMAAALGG
jgi:aryl-alcohol dehydrogenase-like predicted oxidoreductase